MERFEFEPASSRERSGLVSNFPTSRQREGHWRHSGHVVFTPTIWAERGLGDKAPNLLSKTAYKFKIRTGTKLDGLGPVNNKPSID